MKKLMWLVIGSLFFLVGCQGSDYLLEENSELIYIKGGDCSNVKGIKSYLKGINGDLREVYSSSCLELEYYEGAVLLMPANVSNYHRIEYRPLPTMTLEEYYEKKKKEIDELLKNNIEVNNDEKIEEENN